MDHDRIWAQVVHQAEACANSGDEPAGAVLARGEEIVASGRNRVRELDDPIAVAEMDCIRQAGRRSDQTELTLYSSGAPSLLVAGTLLQFSIGGLCVKGNDQENDAVDLLRSKGVAVTFAGEEK